MDKAAGGVVRSKDEWKAIIEAQERSRRSAAGFCREHGIDYSCFLYHRRKVLKRISRALAIERSAGVVPVARRQGFIPIRVEGSCSIRLRFPRGLTLESDGLPPAAWVVEVAERWVGEAAALC